MANYVDSFKSFSKKSTSVDEQQAAAQAPINVPAEFQADQQRINDLNNTISAAEQDLAQKKADLNRLTQELQNKISAKNQQVAQATAQQPAQTPPAV
jgi:cell division protein ZapA (FtsZ GTPase activity inhibitor)